MTTYIFEINLNIDLIKKLCKENPEHYGEPIPREFAQWVFCLCYDVDGDNIEFLDNCDQFYITTKSEATAESFREIDWCYDTDGNEIATFSEINKGE